MALPTSCASLAVRLVIRLAIGLSVWSAVSSYACARARVYVCACYYIIKNNFVVNDFLTILFYIKLVIVLIFERLEKMFNTIKNIFNSYRNGNEKTQLIYETLFLLLSINSILFIACIVALIRYWKKLSTAKNNYWQLKIIVLVFR